MSRLPLFGDLPDTIFQPLSGPNRRAHAAVLDHLHRTLFGAEAEGAPHKREVVAEIGAAVRELGLKVEREEGDPEPEPEDAASPAPGWIYARLRATGWLVEQRDRWELLVEIPPAALSLLDSLSDLARGERHSLGAGVSTVMTNLDAVVDCPDDNAAALDGAYDTALRFNRHMRALAAGLAAIEQRILGDPDALRILRRFFDEFVAGHLIADYRNLLGPNNPYRFRTRVQNLVRDLLADDLQRSGIAAAYATQLGIELAEAETRVLQRLDAIDRAFEAIERQRQRIDRFRARLEKRIQNTVRYLDLTGGSLTDRLAALTGKLAALPQRADAVVALESRVTPLQTPASTRSAARPGRERPPIRPSRLRATPPDPVAEHYQQACRAFDRRIRATPAELRRFIEHNLGRKEQIAASEFAINSLEDLFALHHLATLSDQIDPELKKDYRIERPAGKPTLAANDWLAVSNFVLVRRHRSR